MIQYSAGSNQFKLHTHDATNPGNQYNIDASPIASDPTGWNNFRLVNNAGAYSFFLNNSLIYSTTMSSPGIGFINAPLKFGFLESGSTFQGLLANVQIFAETTAVPVPEPSTILLFGVPLALLFLAMRRREDGVAPRAAA